MASIDHLAWLSFTCCFVTVCKWEFQVWFWLLCMSFIILQCNAEGLTIFNVTECMLWLGSMRKATHYLWCHTPEEMWYADLGMCPKPGWPGSNWSVNQSTITFISRKTSGAQHQAYACIDKAQILVSVMKNILNPCDHKGGDEEKPTRLSNCTVTLDNVTNNFLIMYITSKKCENISY